MTPAAFRRIALSLPDALEGAHMGHADFRVHGKVFATLGWPDKNWAMVKLPPELQDALVRAEPDLFEPASGAWGRQGSTMVRLVKADQATVADAIRSAWQGIVAKQPAKRRASKR
jgi:hypothetical protein